VVLINFVLDGLPTYAMGALMLRPGTKETLDNQRRAFLRTAADKVNGAQCLVACENVCKPKEDGGLGIKRLDTQNASLLLKLIPGYTTQKVQRGHAGSDHKTTWTTYKAS
jgi:hypothetical protein